MLTTPFRNLLKYAAKRTIPNSTLRFGSTKETPKEPINTQEAALNEKLILVDMNDKPIGHASKKECHTVNKAGDILLHRAFSVFLFNNHGDLLLHKRSSEKITYPDCYTNSCCSHPTVDFCEDVEKDALGVKRAAQRRLNFELGIPIDHVPLEKLHYLTRIYYKDEGNGKWGEHEIDYVLFFKGDVPINPNPNEISEISFIPKDEFNQHLPTLGTLTPWFQLISKHRLKLWWDYLDKLEEITDHETIEHLGKQN